MQCTCHRGCATTASSWRPHRRGEACLGDGRFPDVRTVLRRVPRPERLPMGGLILRSALTADEQRWLYEAMYELAERGSGEIESLRATASRAAMAEYNPDNRPQPFVTWVHPYTRESNAKRRPTELLEWAQQLMHALVAESRGHVVDSMLAQMYAAGGSLLAHRDEDLSWGLGVSLGAAAEFDCLPDGGEPARVVIRSGDILVGEFGQMRHAVRVVEPPSASKRRASDEPYLPDWWRAVDSFGCKARCNVLFRQALSATRQRQLAEERSRSVYGMTLAELGKETGRDEPFLCVHLRHASVD